MNKTPHIPHDTLPKKDDSVDMRNDWRKLGLSKISVIVLTALLTFIIVGILMWIIYVSQSNYERGIELSKSVNVHMSQSKEVPYRPDIALLYQMQFSRSFDSTVIKLGGLFLGYATVMLGSIFTLVGIRSFYDLRIKGRNVNTAFTTSSPGLVMITLGALLVITSLYKESKLNTAIDWGKSGVSRGAINEILNLDKLKKEQEEIEKKIDEVDH